VTVGELPVLEAGGPASCSTRWLREPSVCRHGGGRHGDPRVRPLHRRSCCRPSPRETRVVLGAPDRTYEHAPARSSLARWVSTGADRGARARAAAEQSLHPLMNVGSSATPATANLKSILAHLAQVAPRAGSRCTRRGDRAARCCGLSPPPTAPRALAARLPDHPGGDGTLCAGPDTQRAHTPILGVNSSGRLPEPRYLARPSTGPLDALGVRAMAPSRVAALAPSRRTSRAGAAPSRRAERRRRAQGGVARSPGSASPWTATKSARFRGRHRGGHAPPVPRLRAVGGRTDRRSSGRPLLGGHLPAYPGPSGRRRALDAAIKVEPIPPWTEDVPRLVDGLGRHHHGTASALVGNAPRIRCSLVRLARRLLRAQSRSKLQWGDLSDRGVSSAHGLRVRDPRRHRRRHTPLAPASRLTGRPGAAVHAWSIALALRSASARRPTCVAAERRRPSSRPAF